MTNNDNVKHIKARSIVFCQDKIDHTYAIEGFECEMTKENAKIINSLFENTENLVGKNSTEIYKARKQFLKDNNSRYLSLLLFEKKAMSYEKKVEALKKIENEIENEMEIKIKKMKKKMENEMKNTMENEMENEIENKMENEIEPSDELNKFIKIQKNEVIKRVKKSPVTTKKLIKKK